MRVAAPAVIRATLASALAGIFACSPSVVPTRSVIRIGGSDTMVNLVQAWAEAYAAVRPEVSVQVAGGGSGVGIAQWLQGTLDIAASSRELQAAERARAAARREAPPRMELVALDAIAIFVARDNPLPSITLDQLADIYGEAGRTKTWRALGVANRACRGDEIVRVGRQNSSGTYALFRSLTLGARREYALGSIDLNGSREIVTLVGHTPCAIGYSGVAYATPAVKIVPIRGSADMELPTPAAVLDGRYPMARSLWLISDCETPPQVTDFLAWVLSDAGQQIAAAIGFVPAPEGS